MGASSTSIYQHLPFTFAKRASLVSIRVPGFAVFSALPCQQDRLAHRPGRVPVFLCVVHILVTIQISLNIVSVPYSSVSLLTWSCRPAVAAPLMRPRASRYAASPAQTALPTSSVSNTQPKRTQALNTARSYFVFLPLLSPDAAVLSRLHLATFSHSSACAAPLSRGRYHLQLLSSTDLPPSYTPPMCRVAILWSQPVSLHSTTNSRPAQGLNQSQPSRKADTTAAPDFSSRTSTQDPRP